MFQIVLVIVALLYLRSRAKLKRLTSEGFPQVPPEEFDRWRNLELKSIDILEWTVWGSVVWSLITQGFAPSPGERPSMDSGSAIFVWSTAVRLVCMFVLIAVSAIWGARARNLKRSLGITWPKHS